MAVMIALILSFGLELNQRNASGVCSRKTWQCLVLWGLFFFSYYIQSWGFRGSFLCRRRGVVHVCACSWGYLFIKWKSFQWSQIVWWIKGFNQVITSSNLLMSLPMWHRSCPFQFSEFCSPAKHGPRAVDVRARLTLILSHKIKE